MPRSKSSFRPDACSMRKDQVGNAGMSSRPGIDGPISALKGSFVILEVESIMRTVTVVPAGTVVVKEDAMITVECNQAAGVLFSG